jgi:divalent metal cation (Fe/Co/Zn/Cd) transporter
MGQLDRPVSESGSASAQPAGRIDTWLRAARQARLLAWVSLAWMGVEGVVGVLAGVQAHSLGVVTWAASSFVEALTALIVVWRFSGRRTLSPDSEARAQRWVAASFFLLAPYFVIEAIRKLSNGGDTHATVLAIALTASAIVVMPLLGHAKLRLAEQLESGASAGDGIQNLMCAFQAAAALVALVGAGIGLSFLDPIAALVIAAIALREGLAGWRGEQACCTPISTGCAVPACSPVSRCDDDCPA